MKPYKPRPVPHLGRPGDPPPLTNVKNKDYVPAHLREGFDEHKVIKLAPEPLFKLY